MKLVNRLLVLTLLIIYGVIGYSQSYTHIISLAPSLTQMIYLLESDDKLIGCTSYCFNAKEDHKTVVATAIDVNMEKVVMLNPDLVMVTTITKSSTIETLEKAGIKVKVFSTPKSFDGLCKQFIEIGRLTDKILLANDIVNKQNQRLDSLMLMVPKGTKPKIFFEIGANPLFTVIPNTFMDDYITYTGGTNIASDMKRGTITRESVLLRNPDVIVLVTMGNVSDDEKKTWEKYPYLNATQNKKIFSIYSEKACSPTPITFVDVVEQLINQIYN